MFYAVAMMLPESRETADNYGFRKNENNLERWRIALTLHPFRVIYVVPKKTEVKAYEEN